MAQVHVCKHTHIYIYIYTGYVYVHGNAFKLLGEDGLKLKKECLTIYQIVGWSKNFVEVTITA
jgi:hypothetical protein